MLPALTGLCDSVLPVLTGLCDSVLPVLTGLCDSVLPVLTGLCDSVLPALTGLWFCQADQHEPERGGAYSQRGGTRGGGHAPVVEARVTQALLQAGSAPAPPTLRFARNFPREAGLQLRPLGAQLLILGLHVVLAVLALVLREERGRDALTHRTARGETRCSHTANTLAVEL